MDWKPGDALPFDEVTNLFLALAGNEATTDFVADNLHIPYEIAATTISHLIKIGFLVGCELSGGEAKFREADNEEPPKSMSTAVALKLEEWITIGAACRILDKSRSQLYRYIDGGKIKTKRCGTLGWIRVNRDDVDKMTVSNVQRSTYLKNS
jgi:hypothetical protein